MFWGIKTIQNQSQISILKMSAGIICHNRAVKSLDIVFRKNLENRYFLKYVQSQEHSICKPRGVSLFWAFLFPYSWELVHYEGKLIYCQRQCFVLLCSLIQRTFTLLWPELFDLKATPVFLSKKAKRRRHTYGATLEQDEQ